MAESKKLPLYDSAQKIRLMEQVHYVFFQCWRSQLPLSVVLDGAIASLRRAEEFAKEVRKGTDQLCYPDWFVWEGSAEDFLDHLYDSYIPGCVPFDASQTVRRYVEVSFGKDALEYLDGVTKGEIKSKWEDAFSLFSHYLAACSFQSTRLKHFKLPIELEQLAAAALRHQELLPPAQAHPSEPPPPPMKTDTKGNGLLF